MLLTIKTIVEIRCFFIPQIPHFSPKPQADINTLCDFFHGLEREIFPIFAPRNDTSQVFGIFPVVFCFQSERRTHVPRMSKKRKQEWALFLNERNRIAYNELCRKCSNNCKQSFRCIVVQCPKYLSKRSMANNEASGQ